VSADLGWSGRDPGELDDDEELADFVEFCVCGAPWWSHCLSVERSGCLIMGCHAEHGPSVVGFPLTPKGYGMLS
jgi:hypothetical protein